MMKEHDDRRRKTEAFRASLCFAEEKDQYRYELPTCVIGARKEEADNA